MESLTFILAREEIRGKKAQGTSEDFSEAEGGRKKKGRAG